jgi:hypothetical protein
MNNSDPVTVLPRKEHDVADPNEDDDDVQEVEVFEIRYDKLIAEYISLNALMYEANYMHKQCFIEIHEVLKKRSHIRHKAVLREFFLLKNHPVALAIVLSAMK